MMKNLCLKIFIFESNQRDPITIATTNKITPNSMFIRIKRCIKIFRSSKLKCPAELEPPLVAIKNFLALVKTLGFESGFPRSNIILLKCPRRDLNSGRHRTLTRDCIEMLDLCSHRVSITSHLNLNPKFFKFLQQTKTFRLERVESLASRLQGHNSRIKIRTNFDLKIYLYQ